MQQTLLVLGLVWPEPESSAAGRHLLSLLNLFRSQFQQVHFASPAQPGPHQADLTRLGIQTHAIALNDDSFDQWIARLQPDCVVFDRYIMEEQFGWRVAESCPQALRILDTEDLQFLRHARQTAVKQGRPCQYQDLINETFMRELAAIHRCDLSLIISEHEMELLIEGFGVLPEILVHLPFMLTPAQRRIDLRGWAQRLDMATIGNFRHPPNWDSVLQLRRLWPKIRRQLPNARLHIYGAYAARKAHRLHDPDRGFLIEGRAKNALQALSQSRVCLAPLRFGAGLKGKLLDAMRAGTPSVTTPIGAEGMAGKLPWPGRIAIDDETLIAAAIELYTNETIWHQAQQAIKPVLEQRYQAEILAPHLVQRLQEIAGRLQAHRQQNFVGQMLNYHLTKSSRYLSKWIQAKNELEHCQ